MNFFWVVVRSEFAKGFGRKNLPFLTPQKRPDFFETNLPAFDSTDSSGSLFCVFGSGISSSWVVFRWCWFLRRFGWLRGRSYWTPKRPKISSASCSLDCKKYCWIDGSTYRASACGGKIGNGRLGICSSRSATLLGSLDLWKPVCWKKFCFTPFLVLTSSFGSRNRIFGLWFA